MEQPGKTLAVAAETLFLVNLLLLPGLAFAVLLLVYLAIAYALDGRKLRHGRLN